MCTVTNYIQSRLNHKFFVEDYYSLQHCDVMSQKIK